MKKPLIVFVLTVIVVLSFSMTMLGSASVLCSEHNWGTFEEVRKASLFSEGKSMARCLDCGVSMQRTVPRKTVSVMPILIGLGGCVLLVAVTFLIPKRSGKTGRRHKKI